MVHVCTEKIIMKLVLSEMPSLAGSEISSLDSDDFFLRFDTKLIEISMLYGVVDRPNKHMNNLEPKELYLGFYSIHACLY